MLGNYLKKQNSSTPPGCGQPPVGPPGRGKRESATGRLATSACRPPGRKPRGETAEATPTEQRTRSLAVTPGGGGRDLVNAIEPRQKGSIRTPSGVRVEPPTNTTEVTLRRPATWPATPRESNTLTPRHLARHAAGNRHQLLAPEEHQLLTPLQKAS